jgi:hypothetical protein
MAAAPLNAVRFVVGAGNGATLPLVLSLAAASSRELFVCGVRNPFMPAGGPLAGVITW